MSFSFEKFMHAMSTMLAPIGEAVTMLHPGNTNEALKIKVGVAMIQGIAQALHDAHVTPSETVSQSATPTTNNASPEA